MARVLDAPVITNVLREKGNIEGQTADVVPNISVFFSAPGERVNNSPDRCEPCPKAAIRKVVRNFKLDIDARFTSAVARLCWRVIQLLMSGPGKVIAQIFLNVIDHRCVGLRVIRFQGKNVVAFSICDLFSNFLLSPHGIDRDDRFLQVYQPQ